MIDQQYQAKLHKQDYSKKPFIQGVKVIDLPYFSDDGGSFCEIASVLENASIKDHFPEFSLKQINWSKIDPGAIKAGHLHKNQDDIWFVPPSDKLLVGLMDIRENSPTLGQKMRFVLGAGKARLLFIPRGVVHGCANLYNQPMTLLYLVNQNFSADVEENDEYRIDAEVFGEGFWEIAKE